jgi:signal transduction histidine kinase
MEERVHLAGGRFSMTTGRGRGTAIHVRLPLDHRKKKDAER